MPTRAIPPRDKGPAKNSTWHYYQDGYKDPIQAQSYEGLIDAITKFRVDQDLIVGEPEADFEAYLKEKFPSFERNNLRNSTPPAVTTYASDQRNIMDRVRMWVKQIKTDKARALVERTPWKLVPLETAQQRASVCLQCEANRTIATVSLCAPCIVALDRNVTALNEARTSGNGGLGACTALAHDNRLCVHLPEEELTRSRSKLDSATPEKCWLRKSDPPAGATYESEENSQPVFPST